MFLQNKFVPGVVFGDQLLELYKLAKANNFAIPGANVIGSNSVNACMEVSAHLQVPIMIQFSHGGSQFFAGKYINNSLQRGSILGAISGARHIHQLAQEYGAMIVIHTDHCAKQLLPWIDGMLEAGEKYFNQYHQPLFSSHMIDLSAENLVENVETCKRYLERMTKIDTHLEIEIGITGGEEDGVNNEDQADSQLYTKPQDIAYAYQQLIQVSPNFTIAAAFGNVHGVYKPGNVKLKPKILDDCQKYISNKLGVRENTLNFVFHGGSGSSTEEIREAISYGVVKMNIDTDLQWAFWEGIKNYYVQNKDYLASQIGNPEGQDKPNKKIYDPRVWLREAENSFRQRLTKSCLDLNITRSF